MTSFAEPSAQPAVYLDEALWRQRVIDKLLTAPPRSARLTFLTAPAGFGKSTTMAQFAQHARANGSLVAWLDCDERDIDAAVFSERFGTALKRCGVGVAPDEGSLADSLARVATPLTVFIDNFEQAAGPAVEYMIMQILDELPPGASLVLSSRKPPSHLLTRLQLAGKLRIVDADTLRFTPEESEALLGGAMPPESVEQVARYTEGWPFALQLARLRAEGADTRIGSGIGADDKLPRRQIFDYLANEVLATMDPALREFLLDVAVLDLIDADGADAVRGGGATDSLALLRQLVHIRPIAVVDETAWTARLHPLMRDYLVDSREAQAPGRVALLHERAARHLAALGQVHTAMKHAVDGGRLELAAAIMEDAGAIRLVANEGMVRTRLMLKLLPEAIVRKRARLHLIEMVLRLIEGEPSRYEADLDRIEQQILEDRLASSLAYSPASLHDLELARCLVLMELSEHAVQLPPWPTLTRAKDVLRAEAVLDPRMMAIVLPIEIYFLQRLGPIERCERRIDEIVALGQRGAYTHNSPWIPMYHARNALARGQLDAAERLISLSLRQDANFLRYNQASLAQLATGVLGHVAYLRGDIDQAIVHFGELLRATTTFRFEVCYARYVALARCHFANGDTGRAFDLLDDARTLAVEESLPLLDIAASMAWLEFSSVRGAPDLAELAVQLRLEQRWEWAGRELDIPWSVVEHIARARYFYMLAQNRLDLAKETALAFKARAHRLGFRASELTADAMYLQLHHVERVQRPQAKALEALLAETRELGMAQPLVELGPRMMTVLGGWLAHRPIDPAQGENDRWAATLVERLSRHHRERVQSVAGKVFTPREVDVLYELSKGSTTKAIARDLTLSPETIKHHLKAIFAKLGVGNREDAIRQARERQLI